MKRTQNVSPSVEVRRQKRVPLRLDRPPLVEAVFEIRFDAGKAFAGDLLPGMLYTSLAQFDSVEPLPAGRLPPEVRQQEPFRYQPTVVLAGQRLRVMAGDRVVVISKVPPYEGWSSFRDQILRALTAVHATNLAHKVERYSMKCVNVLSPIKARALDLLDVAFRIDGYEFSDRGLQLRAEVEANGYTNIIQVAGDVSVEASEARDQVSGVLVTIDAIRSAMISDFWEKTEYHVNSIHASVKQVFFDVVTDATTESMGPTWE